MADDFSSTTSTSGSIAVGGTATGNIETVNDTDWFRTTLTAGRTYRFELKGSATGDGTLVDRESPVVVLHEAGTGSVAGNDWFLDLDPATASTIPAENVPVFLVVASAAASSPRNGPAMPSWSALWMT